MDLEQAFDALRSRNAPVLFPLRLPTETEVAAAERALGIRLHPDYHRFLLETSDLAFATLEPLVLTAPGSHIDLVKVVREAWASGAPCDQIPFCEDNSD